MMVLCDSQLSLQQPTQHDEVTLNLNVWKKLLYFNCMGIGLIDLFISILNIYFSLYIS